MKRFHAANRDVGGRLIVMVLVIANVARLTNADDATRTVTPPSDSLRESFRLPPFYEKVVLADGFPIVGSKKVADAALLEAAWLIDQMLAERADIRRALIANKVRFSVMATDEFTTNVPEHSDLRPKQYWDRRARGLGATRERPSVSCGEENLLGLSGDPYSTENILIHEFAHAIHLMGLNTVDATFDERLQQTYEAAQQNGLWRGAYGSTNKEEYWAEGVQSWFDTNRENDHDHNHVNTRAELKEYDPALARLVESIFGDKAWRYQHPKQRLNAQHFAKFDFSLAPKFAWPPELLDWNKQFFEKGKLDEKSVPTAPRDWQEADVLPLEKLDMSKSQRSARRASLTFVNQTEVDVRLYWIDFDGNRKRYALIRPNAYSLQDTFTNHVWLLVDPQDKPVALFSANADICRAVIRSNAKPASK